jgi:hypothetical protein
MTATPSEAASSKEAHTGLWRGRAFALAIASPRPLIGIPPNRGEDAPGRTEFMFVTAARVDAHWGTGEGTRLFARYYTDGSPYLTVDHKDSIGYRIWASQHGHHVVGEDGASVLSALPDDSGWWWQRLVLAQVLPIAAAAQGLDLLHASAVAFDDTAIAITAQAGTGKTSLAAHLLDLGGELVADDVVALELRDGELIAHPGVGLVNIDPDQRACLGARAANLLADVAGEGDKLYVLADIVERPSPLAAVYFLQRSPEYHELQIVREEDARTLLASSFIPYLEAPAYLLRHLDVCSRIAAASPPYTILAPSAMPASAVAAAVRAHGEANW